VLLICRHFASLHQWFIVFSGRRTDVEKDAGLSDRLGYLQRSCLCFGCSTNDCLPLEINIRGWRGKHGKEEHTVLLAFFLSKIKDGSFSHLSDNGGRELRLYY
jgi:hypothetical protein